MQAYNQGPEALKALQKPQGLGSETGHLVLSLDTTTGYFCGFVVSSLSPSMVMTMTGFPSHKEYTYHTHTDTLNPAPFCSQFIN